MAKWTTAPTRREITLVLFSLIVFIISFNLNASLRVIGLQPTGPLKKFGLGSDPGFDPDGRRPQAFRDDLENLIFGDWKWEEGQVAGVESKQTKPPSSQWLHGSPIYKEFTNWGNERPISKLVAHAPGYTIIDALVISNGSFYIVTDDVPSWPALDVIATTSADPNLLQSWKTISSEDARKAFPAYTGSMNGVTWLSMDDTAHQDTHTIPAFWRTYSSLDLSVTTTGATLLPPPTRIGFPRINTYIQLPTDNQTIPRIPTYAGFHPSFLKTALPSVGILYAADWADYLNMDTPFVLERVVVTDRAASARGLSRQRKSIPEWAAPFTALSASPNWWTPMRTALARNMGVNDDSKNVVITYIDRQDEQWGPRLRIEDHDTLVAELRRLVKDLKCTVNILSAGSTSWEEIMTSVLKSTVVLGVYGEHLFDGIYMKPSPHATMMEFWPAGTFTIDRQLPVESAGLGYTAWWTDKTFSGDSLPPTSQPADASGFQQTVLIDSKAVAQAIRDLLR